MNTFLSSFFLLWEQTLYYLHCCLNHCLWLLESIFFVNFPSIWHSNQNSYTGFGMSEWIIATTRIRNSSSASILSALPIWLQAFQIIRRRGRERGGNNNDIFGLLCASTFLCLLHFISTLTLWKEYMWLIHSDASSVRGRGFYILSVSFTVKSLV